MSVDRYSTRTFVVRIDMLADEILVVSEAYDKLLFKFKLEGICEYIIDLNLRDTIFDSFDSGGNCRSTPWRLN